MVAVPRPSNLIFLLTLQHADTVWFMADVRQVTFYLDDEMRCSAEAGQHNFISRIAAAVQSEGCPVAFAPNSATERLRSASRSGYALFHMEDPFHPRALSFRRAYLYPFWTIERSADRWNFRAARTRFDPETVDPERAARFCERLRAKHFPGIDRAAAGNLVLVPLQGLLTQHRSFQSCSPLEMLETTLQRCPEDQVLATLHPKEVYSAEEQRALERLRQRYSNLTIQTGGSVQALAQCRLVVTQNSAVAFSGLLFARPAVLFARVDFHHIAANINELGVEGAFRTVEEMCSNYERYVFWFLQKMAINAGRPSAEAKILSALRAGGWKL